MRISESQNKAADAVVELVAGRVGTARAVHPETAIACAARLSGSLLLRSFNFTLDGTQPGTAVLSPEANEKGPQLIGIMAAVLQRLAVPLYPAKLGGESALRGEEPTLTVVQTLDLLQADALSIARENGLSLEETAQAGALATAFLVRECAKDIGGEVGFNVAAFGFIEGCKTVPPIIAPERPIPGEQKPWYKFW